MFNAPRPGQRYISTSTSGLGGSFVDENPLANSVYDDGLDPWSSAPSPAPTPIPDTSSSSVTFSSVIGEPPLDYKLWARLLISYLSADANVPAIYRRAFSAVDSTGFEETSVNSLSRVLTVSGLPAGTIDRVCPSFIVGLVMRCVDHAP